MGWKRILGLGLTSVALALVVWGLVFLPMATVSIKIDLPPAAAPRVEAKPAPINVELLADGSIRVDGAKSDLDSLTRDIAAKASSPPETQRIMIRADQSVTYGAYSEVLKRVNEAGWTKVGLINAEGVDR
ncbi:hypothetical protein ASD38_13585 [Caulobacter sp. Root487D2Y]|uniref:ExbD/TolR family protein n=1 Tax=Caulobacter sp. Root487D2Y TaxID=1736547 RepID=UPI0007017BE9|nr:biopolymer transporter ExbD [Caulobacter sp. Root487D2Y]KQY30298.1 hypothetical protein ASD38_13585 [Caulobacter sp. Root487D2Y]